MPKPRILLACKNGLLTWQYSLQHALNELGLETRLFSTSPRGLSEKLERRRSGGKQLFNRLIARRLCSVAARFRPDLILSLGDLFPRDIRRDLGQRLDHCPLLAAWLCDCLEDSIEAQELELLDAFFSFDSSIIAKAPAFLRDPRQIIPLPLAFDPRQYHALPIRERNAAVLFAGTCTAARYNLVECLRKFGIPVRTLGNGWPHRVPILRQRSLSHQALNSHFNASAVVLNHQQHENTVHGLNLRVFEATGAGTFLLTPETPDLSACFEPGREVVSYRSPEELAELAIRGLNDTAWARGIAEAGHRRAQTEHTFDHRARTIARHFGWH